MKQNTSRVFIERVEDILSYAEIKKILYGILDHMKDDINLLTGANILIKLNLCLLKGTETGATVDPRVAKVLVEWLLENCNPRKIYLCEADATHLGADMAFRALGWHGIFHGLSKVEFLNLSQDDVIPVKGQYLNLKMSKKMMEAGFLISLAKLKTHTLQKITCIMKNQFGAIPYKYKITYHPKLAQAIYDATAARVPDLSIIDGLIAMEGNGPTNGIPKETKLLIASNDPVSIDHFCAKLMGFRPMSVPHLRIAIHRGLGSSDYEVFGNPPNPSNLKFKFLPKWKEILKKGIALTQKGTINEEA